MKKTVSRCRLALPVLALVAASSAAAAQHSSLARLSSLLDAEKLRADHVILVDLSGSMAWKAERGAKKKASPGQSRLDTLLRALPALLNGIPRGDYVAVLGFHGDLIEDPSLLIKDWQGPSSTAGLVAALKKRLTLGRDTDLGRALEGAKKHIERPGANPLQFVYFLTDGQQDASKESPYAAKDAPAWTAAAKDWQGLRRSHNIYVYLFGLYDVAEAGVLARVLPELNFLSFQGTGDLNAFFTTEMDHLQARRIGLLLDQERRQGTLVAHAVGDAVDLSDGSGEVTLELGSSYPHLPVSGMLETRAGSGPDGLVVTATPLDRRVSISSKGTSQALLRLEAAPAQAKWFSLRTCTPARLPVQLGVTDAVLQPEADIDSVGLASHKTAAIEPFAIVVPISRCQGFWPVWMLSVPLSFLLIGAALTCRLWPRKVSVTVQWLDVPTGQDQRGDEIISKASAIRIGSDSACQVRADFLPPVVAILRKRPVGLWGSRIELTIEAADVEVAGRPCRPGAKLVCSGSREIAVDGTTLRLRHIS